MLSGNRRWGDRLSSSSICRGFREGDVSGTCSESWTAGRAVAGDPCKAGLVFGILELQNRFKHLMNKRGIALRKSESRGLRYLGGVPNHWEGAQGEQLLSQSESLRQKWHFRVRFQINTKLKKKKKGKGSWYAIAVFWHFNHFTGFRACGRGQHHLPPGLKVKRQNCDSEENRYLKRSWS